MSTNMLGSSLLAEVAGPLKDFMGKLGGSDGPTWLAAFKRFLRRENPWTVKVSQIWKTVTLGLHSSPSAYHQALKSSGYRISDYYTDQILNKVKVSETAVQLDLVVKTVAELGFKKGATLQQIYDRAKELGLELCPAEVGPALRLAYKDQPYGEWLRIAMEPISGSDGSPKVFGVDHAYDVRWLDGGCGGPDDFWYAGHRWVFVAPRK